MFNLRIIRRDRDFIGPTKNATDAAHYFLIGAQMAV
jgi:hypothetical protein